MAMRTMTAILVIVPTRTLGFVWCATIQGNPNAAEGAGVGAARDSVNCPGFRSQELG